MRSTPRAMLTRTTWRSASGLRTPSGSEPAAQFADRPGCCRPGSASRTARPRTRAGPLARRTRPARAPDVLKERRRRRAHRRRAAGQRRVRGGHGRRARARRSGRESRARRRRRSHGCRAPGVRPTHAPHNPAREHDRRVLDRRAGSGSSRLAPVSVSGGASRRPHGPGPRSSRSCPPAGCGCHKAAAPAAAPTLQAPRAA